MKSLKKLCEEQQITIDNLTRENEELRKALEAAPSWADMCDIQESINAISDGCQEALKEEAEAKLNLENLKLYHEELLDECERMIDENNMLQDKIEVYERLHRMDQAQLDQYRTIFQAYLEEVEEP